MVELHLAKRALEDIKIIHQYSIDEWGNKIADDYIKGFEFALKNIESNPKLLRINSQISKRFRLYRVNKHFLIFESIGERIFLLTVRHVSMDLLNKLKELEPFLEQEVQYMYDRLK